MKNSLLVLSILLTFSFPSFSQIIINYTPKNPYEFKVNTVNDFYLINTGTTKKINVKASITQNQKNVYTGFFLSLTCQSGSNTYASYKAVNESINTNTVKNGALSAGQYELCYTLIDEITQEEIAQSCFDIEVKPLSPPFLIYPSNESSINTFNPNLIWSAPLGSKSNENFTYDLKLVEILNKQQPIDALSQNFALLRLSNLSNTQLLYPFNAGKLINGKHYVWQVIAKNNNGYLAETEIWTFTVNQDSLVEEKVVFFEGYILAKTTGTDGAINIKNELKLYFGESFQLTNIQFDILKDNQQFSSSISDRVVKSIGENKFVIDLDKVEGLSHKKTYFLKVTNRNNNETYLVKFNYFKH
ncbi:MAG: hypothetical protein V4620_08010 [Bacteroidota bacterium]